MQRPLIALAALVATTLGAACGDDPAPSPTDRVAYEIVVVSVADALELGTVPDDLVAELCDGADDFPSVPVVVPVETVIAAECK